MIFNAFEVKNLISNKRNFRYVTFHQKILSILFTTYLDPLGDLLQSVIPKLIIYPLSDQLQRRLTTECVFSWHVEVIHKCHHFLTT